MMCLFSAQPALAAGKPEWISSPQKACLMNELCSLGSGTTLNLAKADAQNEMLKIFENSIKSTFKNTLSLKQGEDLQELTTDEIETMTEGVIQGVKIKETYSDRTGYYVYATLNKRDMMKTLKLEIDQLDDQMTGLMKDRKPSSIKQVQQIYPYREALNRRYAFLNRGTGIASKVSYDEIYAQRRAAVQGKVISLKINASGDKRLPNDLRKLLIDEGFSISNTSPSIEMEGSVTREEVHSKVKGFVKYEYLFELSAKDAKTNKSLGELSLTVEETGRDEKQAYNKAAKQIVDYVKENLADLSL